MVVDQLDDAGIDRLFQAFADTTRRDIVAKVTVGEQSVSELASHYAMSFAAVQKHVAVLERAAVITKQRRGREQIVRVRLETIARARALLDGYEEIWRDRVGRIDELLSQDEKG
ncbi:MULTISPECIES: helix-turn-helix domain-containing protein [unclassified Rhodococcus (in: high G+C Gram-positive bacteria)]|uniref:ArsR/SmtB family transcription factor n=1 Tax=unclassified Rhodococcus (in: high G+C Gram-positive bacteria) TaxID=192944 RepID=UPI0011EC542E|nr:MULTISPECIES: helix-turn-helix domain-containing protein [unclassified Rhodococcus (in: high G+C Gram-positive bacteria)]KAA0922634.1 winged helix-turn-helix transcriptional regulator [Rhodococcus sp. ANT_H53B]MDI9927478.1 helix-turn-helix domain-containing protein [Rhodococcus sp. IEGM 1341]MDV8079101.1 helix-turn-helix domain-containing protein [Rhodococcus sp. IEGM 1370]